MERNGLRIVAILALGFLMLQAYITRAQTIRMVSITRHDLSGMDVKQTDTALQAIHDVLVDGSNVQLYTALILKVLALTPYKRMKD